MTVPRQSPPPTSLAVDSGRLRAGGAVTAVVAGLVALVGADLAHLLVLTTPRPVSFSTWIVGLVTVVGVVLPFTHDGTPGGRLATAAVDLVIGPAVMSPLSGVMRRTVRLAGGPRPGYVAP